jgi:hypothetical protein
MIRGSETRSGCIWGRLTFDKFLGHNS